MAAILLLFVRGRRTPPSEDVGTIERVKGAAHVAFHVRHGEVVRTGVEGDRLAPGDAVEFSYTAREQSYLAIVSVDGAGRAEVYYADGEHAARVEPGVELVLPQSTVLDATLGPEAIYAFFCSVAVPVGPIRARLQADPSRPPDVPECTVDRHAFVKVAP